MQSLIKRKVDISLNAHVEMIQRLVLDAYILNTERHVDKGRRDEVFCPANMLYYRILRQTGHTAALKKLLSKEFQEMHGLRTFGVFHSASEMRAVFNVSRDVHTGQTFPKPDIDRNFTATSANWLGTKIDQADIIVFSDTLHDPRRVKAAQEMVMLNSHLFPNLALVVFLG